MHRMTPTDDTNDTNDTNKARTVRMPESLDERLRAAARKHARPINSEIILRLEESFAQPVVAYSAEDAPTVSSPHGAVAPYDRPERGLSERQREEVREVVQAAIKREQDRGRLASGLTDEETALLATYRRLDRYGRDVIGQIADVVSEHDGGIAEKDALLAALRNKLDNL